jgi:HEPN domain-containing protein
MKETAIEWLLEELNNGRHLTDKLIEQAKEMEKQKIIDAYETAYMDGYYDIGKSGTQYYNEKFNK